MGTDGQDARSPSPVTEPFGPAILRAWGSPQIVTVGALLVLLITLVVDIAVSPSVIVLTVFLAFAPLIASAALGPVQVAGFAVAATALAGLSWLWNSGGNQYWVRFTDVLIVGTLAVFSAGTRVRREHALQASQRIATVAQQALLPVLPNRIGDIHFATRYHSATASAQVGGDFFDFVADGGRVRVILGDISGKGVDAVTQAARVIRAFRQYGASEPDLLSVARRMDEYVLPFWNWEHYATAVLVEMAASADTITVVSCGHPAPVHVTSARVNDLHVHPCLPLGLGPADRSSQHRWLPGDRLLLFTDGLIEARDQSGQFLPRARIDQAVQEPTLEGSLDALEAAVHNHAGRFSDDLALLLLARVRVQEAVGPEASGQVDLDAVAG